MNYYYTIDSYQIALNLLTPIDAKVRCNKDVLDSAAGEGALVRHVHGEQECILGDIFQSFVTQPIEVPLIAGRERAVLVLHLHHDDVAAVAEQVLLDTLEKFAIPNLDFV